MKVMWMALTALVVIQAQQPQQVNVRLSPVPLYPPDGKIAPEFKDQYVFLDPRTSDLVVAYPPLGPAGTIQDTQARKVYVVELAKHVAPVVSANVSSVASNAYQYSFTIANGQQALQRLQRWYLPIPVPTPPDPAKGPAGLAGINQGNGWTRSVYSIRPGQWAIRWERQPQTLAAVGQPESFVLADEHKPGIVRVYLQGAVADHPLPTDMPGSALKQLATVQQLEFNSDFEYTVGPKFGANASRLVIAADFHANISMLTRTRALDGNSPFVMEALSQLLGFVQRPRPDGVAPSPTESFPALTQKPNSSSPLETQIDAAMRLSLGY